MIELGQVKEDDNDDVMLVVAAEDVPSAPADPKDELRKHRMQWSASKKEGGSRNDCAIPV